MDLLASLHATLKTYIDEAVAEAMKEAAPAQVSRTIDQGLTNLVREIVNTDTSVRAMIKEQVVHLLYSDESECVSDSVDTYLDGKGAEKLETKVAEIVEEALDSTSKIERYVNDKLENMSFNISVN